MEAAKRILFVCTGNTCRSAMAEAILLNEVKSLPNYEVRSAGTQAWAGDEMTPDAITQLEKMGVDGRAHRSTKISPWLIDWATDIYVMTRSHREYIRALFPGAVEKLYLLSFDQETDIPDPYGQGSMAYEKAFLTIKTEIFRIMERASTDA